MSFVGNRGTFTRGYRAVILDMAFLYHVAYVLVCMLGLFVHEFFYSFLVSTSLCGQSLLKNIHNAAASYASLFDFFKQSLALRTNYVIFRLA